MWIAVITIIVVKHIATTSHGGILSDVFSSASKYLINPAAEWKPSPFCLAIIFSPILYYYIIVLLYLDFTIDIFFNCSKNLNIY